MNINLRIIEVRKHENMNKSQFSNTLGIDSSQYSKIEIGKLQPTINLLMKIQSEFKIDLNWLMTGNGEMFLKEEIERKNSVIGTQNMKRLLEIQELSKEDQKQIYNTLDALILHSKNKK